MADMQDSKDIQHPHLTTSFQDVDETLAKIGDTRVFSERLTPAEDRRILRRIDMCLLPLLVVSYMLQFLDKQALQYTAIMGLQSDLHLKGQQYAWASSIFYFGYLGASYPVSLIMVKFPIGKFCSISVFAWSVVLMSMAACRNAGGLMAARFFLGFCEAAVAPGFSIITAMWYKREEQPLRHGAWYMGSLVASLFGGLITYGMAHVTSIAPWRGVFLIFGGITLAWSVVLFFTLPDTPLNAKFLSEEERIKAVERIQNNMTGIKNDHWKKEQVIEALLDPKTWAIVLFFLACNIPNGGLTSFGSIIVKGFGFSTFTTLLVQMIGVAFQLVYVLTATGGSTLFKNTRTLWMGLLMCIAIAGVVMIREITSAHIWAKFMGMCLMLGFTATFPMVMTMTASNTAGFTKKTTVNAITFIAYCTGNIIGPQLFFAREAPGYTSGFLAVLVCFSAGVVIILSLRAYLIWLNTKRDALGATAAVELDGREVPDAALNLMDKTDKQLPQFRYVY